MKANRSIREKRFNRLVIVTIVAVYLLILVGGIVRSTGSGMGCPDWPRCFGSWVPPTSEEALPLDYRERYAEIRVKKNSRLAKYLTMVGLKDLALAIQDERIAAPEAEFNKFKTWTEYFNRLIGVFVGFLITLMAISSTWLRGTKPALFYGSLGALLLVVFQGWIGSVVVSTNLLPGLITFHMALALLLIGLLLYLLYRATEYRYVVTGSIKGVKVVLLVTIALVAFQIALGSQVREAVDLVSLQLNRDQWIANLGNVYGVHRTFSLVLLVLCGYLTVKLRQYENKVISLLANLLIMMVVVEITLGITMAYFSVPAWAQPLHLTFSMLLLGLLYWLYLKTANQPQND